MMKYEKDMIFTGNITFKNPMPTVVSLLDNTETIAMISDVLGIKSAQKECIEGIRKNHSNIAKLHTTLTTELENKISELREMITNLKADNSRLERELSESNIIARDNYEKQKQAMLTIVTTLNAKAVAKPTVEK